MTDLEAYLGVHARLRDLLRPDDASVAVPACPGWTVHDVVGHLTGLCEDWVAGRLDGYASEEWTGAQIRRFEGRPLNDVLARWDEALVGFARLDPVEPFGDPARWAFGDAVTHEADVREALGREPVPGDAVGAALKGTIARWRTTLADASTPTLLLRAVDAREWWLGAHDDPDATVVETTAYEVFRAVAGRRTADQVRAWAWSGDPEPFLAAGLPYPFRWATWPSRK